MEINSSAAFASEISHKKIIKKNDIKRSQENLAQDKKGNNSVKNVKNLVAVTNKKETLSKARARAELNRTIQIKTNQDQDNERIEKKAQIAHLAAKKSQAPRRSDPPGSRLDISV